MNLSRKISARRILWLGDLQFEVTLWNFLEQKKKLRLSKYPLRLISTLINYTAQVALYRLVCRNFNKVVCCSKSAEARLRRIGVRAEFLPFPYPARKPINFESCSTDRRSFLFYGNLLGTGSISGLEFLLTEFLPAAINEWGDGGFQLVICGRTDLSMSFQKRLLRYPEVKIIGYVDDLDKIMERSHAMLVPISIPVGNRTRVIDGMSSGLVVVGHTNLSLGNPFLINGINCLLANTGREIVQALEAVYRDEDLRKKLSRNARTMYELTYGDQVAHETLIIN